MAAAEAFFRSAKAVTGLTPDRVTTDGHDSYPRAIRTELGKDVRHRTSAYLNNRLEQDHRGIKGRYRPMRGDRDRHDVRRLALDEPQEPRRLHALAAPGPAQHGLRADNEKAPQVRVAALRDAAQPLLAAARVLAGHKADPGGELPARAELRGIGHAGGDERGVHRADAGD